MFTVLPRDNFIILYCIRNRVITFNRIHSTVNVKLVSVVRRRLQLIIAYSTTAVPILIIKYLRANQ